MSEAKKIPRPSDIAGRLDGLVKLLRWPERKGNNMNPLFVIVWKAVFWPVMVFGFVISFVAIFCAHGPREAARWWGNAT